MNSAPNTRANRPDRGFTAVEALVSVAVLGLVVLFTVTMFQSSNRISRSASVQGDSQQSARLAIDLITKDLRSLGYGVDVGGGQRGLAFAGPWDLVFNANITPAQDNPLAPGSPGAIDPARAPAAVPAGAPLYAPAVQFGTGAETVRYTLDSNGDGVVDNTDNGDDPEEATPNPNDFVLRKEIYGARPDGTNGGAGEPVAIVRGPLADQDGTVPVPLLQYWLDDDDDDATPEVLHGDADGDGTLSQAEIAAVGPVPAGQLALVTRAVITVTAEDGESSGRGDYRTREVASSVAFRNFIRRTSVIAGVVYQDTDGDGSWDPSDETGIAGVTVRLNSGDVMVTGATGQYAFEVTPGAYTVTELDPPGFISTTTNTVPVTATTGSTHTVVFGDRPGSGVGEILGTVYYDVNQNQLQDGGEPGLGNVVITLHTGLADTTDTAGGYLFQVPVGTYTVVETDSIGWASTTSNAVEVILSSDGQREWVDFGDVPGGASGTIRGIVYLDLDADGVRDAGEGGIADVPILVAGLDSTVTDGAGQFLFTVPVGVHAVIERDPAGYSSSTPNLISNIVVTPDSTVDLEFGDIYEGTVNFTVVAIGTTDRALSLRVTDLREDNKGDPDIILGTQLTTGTNNLHVWHNKRTNSGTPITALFDATPTFSRVAGGPIPTMLQVDLDGDTTPDLLTGLELTTAANLKTWRTITSGGAKGMYPVTPTSTAQTVSGSTVLSVQGNWWPGYTGRLLLVGTRTASSMGTLEIWSLTGSTLTHHAFADLSSDAIGALHPVTAVATADFDGDGYPDIAAGQDLLSGQGRIAIFLGVPGGTPSWSAAQRLVTDGAVLSLATVDMAEDDQRDPDLLVGTSKAAGVGRVELWTNTDGTLGSPGALDGEYVVSDWIDAGGEVLSLGVARLDRDIFPDVVAGIRTAAYAGKLDVYRTFGYLPSAGTTWSSPGSGEVVTLTVSDFNIDGLKDVAVGTRTAVSTGELIVYFGQ